MHFEDDFSCLGKSGVFLIGAVHVMHWECARVLVAVVCSCYVQSGYMVWVYECWGISIRLVLGDSTCGFGVPMLVQERVEL